MRELLGLGLVLVFGYFLWTAFKPQCAFVIAIRDGVARLARGKATQAFVDAVSEVCGECDLQRGEVRGIRQKHGLRLEFSWQVPAPCRQRIRNIWAMQR